MKSSKKNLVVELLVMSTLFACIFGNEENDIVIEGPSDVFFLETFEKTNLEDGKWTLSLHEKYTLQEIDITTHRTEVGPFVKDRALVLEKSHHHYCIATKFESPFEMAMKNHLVLQYEVRLQEGLECGGAYLKLLPSDNLKKEDLKDISDTSPYVIMFGPDKCGNDKKVHLILRYENPVTHVFEEKHLVDRPHPKVDTMSHLYTLVINGNENTFEVYIDMESVASGSLYGDAFSPTFLPSATIPDIEEKQPENWIMNAEMEDTEATKPIEWDEDAPRMLTDTEAEMPAGWLQNEEEMISDPKAFLPEDWEEEEDGVWVAPVITNPLCETGCGPWTAPQVPNPLYKGKWTAPMIPNPEYIGEWKPREIVNPDFFKDDHVAHLPPIGALAIEVWTTTGGITFDNLYMGNDVEKALGFATQTWGVRSEWEKEQEKINEKESEVAEAAADKSEVEEENDEDDDDEDEELPEKDEL